MNPNNTQTRLLSNQTILSQLQQNNGQKLNGQPLLFPNQQPLAQIRRNINGQPTLITGQTPLLNVNQNIPQQIMIHNQKPLLPQQLNNIQPINIPNKMPRVQPQLNSIQPINIPNKMAMVQPQINSIQPVNIPNKMAMVQPQINNIQPAIIPNQSTLEQQTLEKLNQNTQTSIENNINYINSEADINQKETNYIQSMINELKVSEYAKIEYSRGTNQKKVFKKIYNCHPPETFDIYLGNNKGERNSFNCIEVATCFQRYCLGTSKRQFDMDVFYNTSDEEVEFTKDPILKIHRIEGGCCSDRGIMTVKYPNDIKPIGTIIQANLANIYNSKNQLLYRVKLPFDPPHKNCFQRFLECCCKKSEEIEGEERDYNKFLIKKLVEKEEQVEDTIVKKNVQELVGKMENDYPLTIIFPNDASPKEKILLIICRIFLLYMSDFSVTLRERWCKETIPAFAEDILEDQFDQTILGRINQIDNIGTSIENFGNTLERAATNKNILSMDYFDD